VEGNSTTSPEVAHLPLWLRVSGVIVFVGSAILSARLIWEQTVWTWERGPQMVGFSLAHGAGAILLLFPLLLLIWLAVVVGLTVRSLIKRNPIAPVRWAALTLAISLLVVGDLPEGFWERVFISRMAASPYAGELFRDAAYAGDLSAVRGFISHGVPVDSIDHLTWETALHAAASGGHILTIRYLISKGANINALDRFGDSPLELASSRGHSAAAEFLAGRGAERIRGDDAQRQKALGDETREEMEKLSPGSTTWHR